MDTLPVVSTVYRLQSMSVYDIITFGTGATCLLFTTCFMQYLIKDNYALKCFGQSQTICQAAPFITETIRNLLLQPFD